MKKILLLIPAFFLFIGCNRHTSSSGSVNEFIIVEIDSCEYIKSFDIGGYSYFAHKGNCKYCIERRKKEFYYVVDYLFDMQD